MVGLETLISIGTTALTSIATDIFKTYGNRIIDRLDVNFSEVLELKNATRQYVLRYANRHGLLKVLGMREPVLLESVYTSARFLDNNSIYNFESVEALEETYRKHRQRSFSAHNRKTLSGLDIANQKQYLMVLGGPGSGKSTFLRKIGLEALKGKQLDGYSHLCIPVFIELKQLRFNELDIESMIAKEFEICGFPSSKKFTNESLKTGKLLVILDGLDEVPTEKKSEAISKIQNFAHKYYQNRFIVSCRIAAYRHNFQKFTDVMIAEFSDKQIKNFIIHWFHQYPKQGESCWQQLQENKHVATKELTHTPVLLTLICLVYQRGGQLPNKRATLYARALQILLEEWDAEKEVPREAIYKGLDSKSKELMLAEIAHHNFVNNQLFFDQRVLATQIEALLGDLLPDETIINGDKVLQSIELQHGLFVERAEGVYSFSHLTLQEFLTAQHIISNISQANNPIETLVKEHLLDDRWREVFLLLSGLKLADDLLLAMEQESQKYLNTPRIHALLKWSNESTYHSDSHRKSASKRAIAISLILILNRTFHNSDYLTFTRGCIREFISLLDNDFYYSFVHDSTSAFALERDLDLDIALINKQEPDNKLTNEEERNIARALCLDRDLALAFGKNDVFPNVDFTQLVSTLDQHPKIKSGDGGIQNLYLNTQAIWLNALSLNSSTIALSDNEIKSLYCFFKIQILMLECRQSAVRVSRKVWHSIEDRMIIYRG